MAQGVSNAAGHGQIQLGFFLVAKTRMNFRIQWDVEEYHF